MDMIKYILSTMITIAVLLTVAIIGGKILAVIGDAGLPVNPAYPLLLGGVVTILIVAAIYKASQ